MKELEIIKFGKMAKELGVKKIEVGREAVKKILKENQFIDASDYGTLQKVEEGEVGNILGIKIFETSEHWKKPCKKHDWVNYNRGAKAALTIYCPNGKPIRQICTNCGKKRIGFLLPRQIRWEEK